MLNLGQINLTLTEELLKSDDIAEIELNLEAMRKHVDQFTFGLSTEIRRLKTMPTWGGKNLTTATGLCIEFMKEHKVPLLEIISNIDQCGLRGDPSIDRARIIDLANRLSIEHKSMFCWRNKTELVRLVTEAMDGDV